ITPIGIQKKIADIMEGAYAGSQAASPKRYAKVAENVLDYASRSPEHTAKRIRQLEQRMYEHARNLEFEQAASARDEIGRLKEKLLGAAQQQTG
ncbi:MAG: UvrB/UvrC motif-containing protein, partial [Gammaproteobacteria bacterium]|nr:UvrB/UvrC motif-containing protein [Gammaproteobacteria bacterium]